MSNNYITWNGIRSDALGLSVEHYPNMNRPARKHTVADVPGRNGSVYLLQNAWSEVVQSYEVSAKSPVASFKGVAEWLASANGYAILQDSYDPTIYRMAVCVNPFEVQNSLNRAGRALIQFNCRPERYIANAQNTVINSGASASIQNSTNHEAHPLLKIEGQGYPSMLPTTDRTAYTTEYDYGTKIYPLTPSKVRYNLIGLTMAYSDGEYTFALIPGNVSAYSTAEGSITATISDVAAGIGMNRSVQPLTTYTISFLYTTASYPNYGMIDIICTDKNGNIGSVFNNAFYTSASVQSLTFTTDADAYWVVVLFRSAHEVAFTYSDIQFNFGSEALDYLAYTDSTASAFAFGDCIIKLSKLEDYMYIDTETMNAYRNAGENLNNAVTITDLSGNLTAKTPRLIPGTTLADLSGEDVNWITKLSITPRFWTL